MIIYCGWIHVIRPILDWHLLYVGNKLYIYLLIMHSVKEGKTRPPPAGIVYVVNHITSKQIPLEHIHSQYGIEISDF